MFLSPFLEASEYEIDAFFVEGVGFYSSGALENNGIAVREHN